MNLPKGQDVIADVPLLGWTEGPLPNMDLELAAAELFADAHPRGLWGEPDMTRERDQARRQIVRAYLRFLQMNRWTLGNMDDRLEDGFGRIVFGDRGPSASERTTLHDYARTCLQGLFARFSGDRHPIVLPDAETHTWAIPRGQGISEQWQQSYVATKMAEVLTALACPGVPFLTLDVEDRTWLRQLTDSIVEAAVARFQSGDRK